MVGFCSSGDELWCLCWNIKDLLTAQHPVGVSEFAENLKEVENYIECVYIFQFNNNNMQDSADCFFSRER
jgi:hypothetical protein